MKRRPTAYIALSDVFEEDPRLIDLASEMNEGDADSATLGYIRLLAAAKRQNGGVFTSDAHIRHLLGRHARFLPAYRAAGLVDGLSIADWDAWQVDREDPTNAERQQRFRDRQRAGDRNGTVTRYVTPEERRGEERRADEMRSEAASGFILKKDSPHVVTGPSGSGNLNEAWRRRFGDLPPPELLPEGARDPGAAAVVASVIDRLPDGASPLDSILAIKAAVQPN